MINNFGILLGYHSNIQSWSSSKYHLRTRVKWSPKHVGFLSSLVRTCLATYSLFCCSSYSWSMGFSWGHVVRWCFFCLLQAWLQRYGYLHHTQPNMAVLRSAQSMHSAIAAMQHKYGLNVTGTLDKGTIEWVQLSTHTYGKVSPVTLEQHTLTKHPLWKWSTLLKRALITEIMSCIVECTDKQ